MAIVEPDVRVDQVVIVPRNGLANRLQAWASAAILAAEWDVPLKVVWETEPAMPAEAADLFAPHVVRRWFSDPGLVTSLTGSAHSTLPRYLTRAGRALVLAGHDRGEQAFMPEVVDALGTVEESTALVLIAGGKFHLPGNQDFTRQRGLFYRELTWSDAVDTRFDSGVQGRGPYSGLHIRQTDRSLEAPTRRMIREGLRQLRDEVRERDLFIAADTDEALASWAERSTQLGFTPWSLSGVDRSRTQVEAVIAAAADWRVLSGATGLVHPAVSTFSGEAAVASGHPEHAIALEASSGIQRMRSLGALVRSALTFPARRLRPTPAE